MLIRRSVLAAAFLAATFLPCLCRAEEPLFLDGNPRYPLVYALENYRHYLDLDSCTLISGNADSFEISAEYIHEPQYPSHDYPYECRFRKNEESGGELQVWDDYSQKWCAIYNPYDQATVEGALKENGDVYYRLPDFYKFKCIYRQLFGIPYGSDTNDEELRRSLILPVQSNASAKTHQYLWDHENYPCIWRHQELAWHLDKHSVYVELDAPPQYILRILVLSAPQVHNNDIVPRSIDLYRLRYDEDEGKMFVENSAGDWRYMPPDGSSAESGKAMYIGEAAFYITYGRRFYGASPKWNQNLNAYFDVFDDAFYELLDGHA